MDAVKFSDLSEKTVAGLAAPYGGPFAGKDLQNEFFSVKTNFALDWYDEIPLLYQHGHDPDLDISVVGRVKSRRPTEAGIWAESQLDASNKYFEVIKELIKKGKLFFSSGALPYLVRTDQKSGEILVWPMCEISLTPTPSNLLASTTVKGLSVFADDAVTEQAAVAAPVETDALRLVLTDLDASLDAILSR